MPHLYVRTGDANLQYPRHHCKTCILFPLLRPRLGFKNDEAGIHDDTLFVEIFAFGNIIVRNVTVLLSFWLGADRSNEAS